jgi:hypothetical protein
MLINANLFALVFASILRLILILFFAKVHRTIREEPLIRFDKLIFCISSVYNPKVKTFFKDPLFLTPC